MEDKVTATDNDNIELGIADYYTHFPSNTNTDVVPDDTDVPSDDTGKKVWL